MRRGDGAGCPSAADMVFRGRSRNVARFYARQSGMALEGEMARDSSRTKKHDEEAQANVAYVGTLGPAPSRVDVCGAREREKCGKMVSSLDGAGRVCNRR
jgi:hypothetical protein